MSFTIGIWITHSLNLLFIGLFIRIGIQVAGAHPRLY